MGLRRKTRIGIPPEVNVIGTLIFLIAVGFVGISTLLGARRAGRADEAAPVDDGGR